VGAVMRLIGAVITLVRAFAAGARPSVAIDQAAHVPAMVPPPDALQ
jgi:hypothetical protein